MPHLGEKLKDHRLAKEFNQAQMAEYLGVSFRSYQDIEKTGVVKKSEVLASILKKTGLNTQNNAHTGAQGGNAQVVASEQNNAPTSLEQADNATLLRILDNLSAAHREISESNNKLADNEKFILMKLPTAGSHGESPSDEYATLQGVRGLLIEFYADVKKTTLQEAESVLGTKVVAAKKKVGKKDILSDAGK